MRADLSLVGKALGAACEAVRPGEAADAVGGTVPAFVAAPSSTAQAAALMRVAAEHDLAVVPRGSGSRLHWGVPPSRCDLIIDTLLMGQVIEHAAGDLVARVQAGARVGEVAAVLAAAGQEIALDVPPTATIGGVVADALAGSRRLRYGSPRDLLIGITIVRADGIVARSGGKVVKNVAGYDLGKLFAGSAGTLGLITEVTFRLHPLPAARAWVTADFPGTRDAGGSGGPGSPGGAVGGAAAAVAAAANSPLVASAVELSRPGPGGPVAVSVLLEGSAAGVTARAASMARLLSGARSPASADIGSTSIEISTAAPPWWGGVPGPGPGADGAAGTLVRVTFWVSALGRVLDAIDGAARESGTRPVVHGAAGAGVLSVTLDADAPPAGVARLVAAIREAIPAGRGGAVVIAAPGRVRSVTGNEAIPGAGLMRAVKDQFDPGGRMAPGRLFEGLS
ncbi:MAG TPA: FAD-binding oxidoreductase [Trebonia sp.]